MSEKILELENKIQNLETENSILQTKLDSKDETIEYMQEQIDKKDDKICELEDRENPSHDDIIGFLESDLLDITSTGIQLYLGDFKYKKVFISLE